MIRNRYAFPDLMDKARAVLDAVAGFGPLQRYLDDPGIEEIWINDPSRVFVARAGRHELTTTILDDGQKKADRIEKNYRMGAITDQERYAQLIDLWGHARKQVTDDLMAGIGYGKYSARQVLAKFAPEGAQPAAEGGASAGDRSRRGLRGRRGVGLE